MSCCFGPASAWESNTQGGWEAQWENYEFTNVLHWTTTVWLTLWFSRYAHLVLSNNKKQRGCISTSSSKASHVLIDLSVCMSTERKVWTKGGSASALSSLTMLLHVKFGSVWKNENCRVARCKWSRGLLRSKLKIAAAMEAVRHTSFGFML